MEDKRSTGKVTLNYGIITGLALVLYSLLLYSLDATHMNYVGLVSYVILIAGMVIGALNHRKNDLEGYMNYSKAFGVTFLIGLFASVVLGIYSYLFYEFFAPEQLEVIIRRAEEEMWKNNQNLSDEQFEIAMEYTKKFSTPFWLGLGAWFSNTVASLVIALIVSIFVRKSDDSFNSTFKQES